MAQKTYSTDRLPEEALPAALAENYQAAGYECARCDFIPQKDGFSGRQALRAHLKRHKNEDRAWQVPMARQALVVATMVAAGVIGWLDMTMPEPFQGPIPLLGLPSASVWGLFGISIAALVMAMSMLTVEAEVGGRVLAKVLSSLRGLGSLVGVWALSGIWGFLLPEPSLIILAPVVVLVALTPMLAGRAGYVRLLVKRREVRSGSYLAMVRPKNAEARWESWTWWSHRRPQP